MLSGASVVDYTYQLRTVSLNKWIYQIQTWIWQAQDEWDFDENTSTDFPIATASLIANQDNYAMPITWAKVKRVELTYDGVNYHVASPLDAGSRSTPTDTTSIAANFSEEHPYYDIVGNSIIVYPVPTATQAAGLKVFYDRLATAYTYTSEASNEILTGTKSPGFDANFHDLVALGMAYDWRSAKLGDKNLLTDIMAMKGDLQNHYGSKQKDRVLTFGAAFVDYE